MAHRPWDADASSMTKQRLVAALWFLMGWMLGNVTVAFLGFPALTGLWCGSAMAAVVLMDPVGAFQARRQAGANTLAQPIR